MLVYRNNRRPRPTSTLLAALTAEGARLAAAPADHDDIRDLLVAFDSFESGIADRRNSDADDLDSVQGAVQGAALALAEVFRASMANDHAATAAGLCRLLAELSALQQLPLPATIDVAEAEGYAWYALFPEGYALAVRRFLAEVRPRAAVCIGIRQIGCSLSAVAAAELAAAACPVFRCTVRPRGHPFARTFQPAPALTRELRRHADTAHFLIIDEGPGLSGSSLCCVAETLAGWGIPEERILFFPAWDPEAGRFRSPLARLRWPRHRKYAAGFDPAPLLGGDAGSDPVDLADGRWREILLPRRAWPAVQPQHERRKFLLHPPAAASPTAGYLLAKFAGFGETGKAAWARGAQLAAAGFIPPVLGRRAGFLFTPFLPGRPLAAGDVGPPLLERLAAYLACLRTDFPAAAATPADDLSAMLRHNVAVGLGEEWGKRLPDLTGLYVQSPATAIDGRMLPHEWLRTAAGYVKTDALDHHADHFFPGDTDIAWDLAATEIEFRLRPAQAAFLRRCYATLAGDMQIDRRLPFHRLAWLAFRLGYTQLAAEGLAGAEAARFRRRAALYADLLRQEITRQSRSAGG